MKCPHCNREITAYRNPTPTVDIIIEVGSQIVLIERKNPPYGWALPGGFVDYGETYEAAALREAEEETGLTREDIHLEKTASPVAFTDEDADASWRVHPFLFTAARRDIEIDWEHQDYRWVAPSDIGSYDTVPRLREVVKQLLA